MRKIDRQTAEAVRIARTIWAEPEFSVRERLARLIRARTNFRLCSRSLPERQKLLK